MDTRGPLPRRRLSSLPPRGERNGSGSQRRRASCDARPMSARERKAGEARSLLCNGDTISMGKRAFRFDNVLAEQSSQDNVFCELADQVDGFLSVRAM